ncbi:hypothetical protein GDO81_025628 [Engystomops pustulosus]|uniref:Immunoglobulin V-set domain-containing protein n=1 Tax=Engystomops pustulosus TaxID=76066 RepID=A0AAV6ZM17_ENGPU|nr:hypothetical protein GDO81_025628 [Engystomops pustulosus]
MSKDMFGVKATQLITLNTPFPLSPLGVAASWFGIFFSRDREETVTISCTASAGMGSWLVYQQKPGEWPKLLIFGATTQYTGVPDRVTGSGFGTDFEFTIKVTEDDAADYYCQQVAMFPLRQ